jgi:ABC-2 type transport system ATP-binding protein
VTDPGFTVVAQGLRKVFVAADGKPFDAIDDLSFRIRAGTLTALTGPDGAGKTTLMRMMAGLLRPDAGTLQVLGEDVSRRPQAVQNRISYMPQRFGLYEDLSVQENLDLYADLHGVPMEQRRERFSRMLEMTDMARFTARPAGKLSGGMKQKLGLACTLVRSPDLLLLDEPSVGVDPLSRRDLWTILEQLIEGENLSVIVSTAYMDEAARCTDVFVVNRGRLLAEGSPEELSHRAKGLTYEAAPPPGMPARVLQARLIDAPDRIVDAVPRGGRVWFIRQPDCDEAALRALLPDTAFEPRVEELEDAFMALLREHDGDGGKTAEHAPAVTVAESKGDGHPAIVVRDLVRRFGDFTAVASTSFSVAQGKSSACSDPTARARRRHSACCAACFPRPAAISKSPG